MAQKSILKMPLPESTLGRENNEEWREWEDSVLLLEQNRPKAIRAPFYAWPLLVIGVMAVSSAGVVFDSMSDVPPVNLAAWRLQLTGLILLPGAIGQWRRMTPERKKDAQHSSWILLLSGTCLCIHFASFVWGIQHTSLPHSLLLVSATPIILAFGALCLRKPISNGELLGALFGLVGTLILAIGAEANSTDEATVAGDLSSLVAAVAIAGYLSAGSKLREWMPLFIYACPVTVVASFMLSIAAMIFESVSPFAAGASGLFGWLASGYWWKVVYLAVGPGLMGHTVFNHLLKFLSPLVIALALMMEPVVGSLLGWVVGVSPLPIKSTWGGGVVLFFAMVTVTVSSHKRQQRMQAKQEASLALSRVFADNDDEEAQMNQNAPSRATGTELTSRSPWPRDLVRASTTENDAVNWASIEAYSSTSPRQNTM